MKSNPIQQLPNSKSTKSSTQRTTQPSSQYNPTSIEEKGQTGSIPKLKTSKDRRQDGRDDPKAGALIWGLIDGEDEENMACGEFKEKERGDVYLVGDEAPDGNGRPSNFYPRPLF